ncbi:hypothetical protein OOK39_21080 [Streptomyces sp. NBC_00264]|uniref:hypothetical protein n=1 Tax=unclassified Streptomyces TaxID=2593676 RepID=UPI002252719E|nr:MULTISPECIES: hypothetical protein [unclassified Streptomyces]MCX5161732.1 hypothetical protein [Streptomyces sp. NBC_00305]MCX5220255.1 hypothetical protein [Streptomyces sp. NBC_00264]
MTSSTGTPVPLPANHRISETYVDWARARVSGAEADARDALERAGRGRYRAWEKPGRFMDETERLAPGLPAAHLPWFWDTIGHWMLETHRRSAARAYGNARTAERTHGLPVDPDWRSANLRLFARFGALPATELSGAPAWLTEVHGPVDAHREFTRLLTVWAASPGELPADLARRVRDSARAAGLGTDEEARVLGEVLASAPGKAVPDRLLDAALAPLTAHPPADDRAAALLDLFPESKNDAAAWLRLLIGCGAADAAATGRIAPEGGLGEWLRRYATRYSHRTVAGGGVTRQAMPVELFELVARFAPLLKEDGTPVRLHEDRYRWPHLDADLLDACLAEGVPVHDPGATVPLEFWDKEARRDLRALAADPVFGSRLEGTVHAGLRSRGGTAISRLPHNPGIAAEVHGRIEKLLDSLRGGGLAAADEAVDELHDLLDRPTAIALDGIEEALDALDLTGPLARALRAGLPEELGWPAMEEALAEFRPDETVYVTSTWPVLTLYGESRAFAVDHAGRRGEHTLELPECAVRPTVHWVGGQFLVAWSGAGTGESNAPDTAAYWSGSPADIFMPEESYGLRPYGGSIRGGLGYQFQTPDGGGRFDGGKILRPGGTGGIGHRDYQMYDGQYLWSTTVFSEDRGGGWLRVDPATGEPTTDRPLPGFHTPDSRPDGTKPFPDHRILAELPPGAPPSPLGQDGRLTGCRVDYRTPYAGPSPREFELESIDGRTASYRTTTWGRRPWGILGLPSGGEDAVVVGSTTVRCHAAEDNSLLWQVRGFPGSHRTGPVRTTLGEQAGPVPPPAFWHFLTPRDEPSSGVLRAVTDEAVRELLSSGAEDALPGVTDPRIRQGLAHAARLAADVLRRRRELSHRVAVMRSGPVVELPDPEPDTRLVPALHGLLPQLRGYEERPPQPQPAVLTAVAADGRYLRGEIDDEVRVLALPAPPSEWAGLTGRIDAVAWRAAVAVTPDEHRRALTALLGVWSRQPFAEPGTTWRTGRAPEPRIAELRSSGVPVASGPVRSDLVPFLQRAADPAPADAEECETRTIEGDDATRLPRLLALLAERGPLPVPEEAVDLFRWRTGMPRAIAALVLDGFAGSDDYAVHLKLCRAKPYKADRVLIHQYDVARMDLRPEGRRAVLAAALPADPADLWSPGGMTAAADRMATEWCARLAVTSYADDGSHAAALAKDHGLPATWASALLTGSLEHVEEAPLDAEGIRSAVTALTWAFTERPAGDPATEGARALLDRLTDIPADQLTALRALADRTTATPVPPGQYEANPLFSVPDLVDEVAASLGVGRDAAALHLQLHAFDRPADRTVRRWNTWTLDHHRAVRKELTAAKAPRPAPTTPTAAVPLPAHERFARAWAEAGAPPRR